MEILGLLYFLKWQLFSDARKGLHIFDSPSEQSMQRQTALNPGRLHTHGNLRQKLQMAGCLGTRSCPFQPWKLTRLQASMSHLLNVFHIQSWELNEVEDMSWM